jgi:hypothetical protein
VNIIEYIAGSEIIKRGPCTTLITHCSEKVRTGLRILLTTPVDLDKGRSREKEKSQFYLVWKTKKCVMDDGS